MHVTKHKDPQVIILYYKVIPAANTEAKTTVWKQK